MKILSKPKGNAEEYGRWSVNPYLGCSHQCAYCYLQSGPGAKTLGGDVPHLKSGVVSEEHAYHLAMAEIIENREAIIRDGGLFMTFTSDPLISENRDLMLTVASDALRMDIPVTMLTKDATFTDIDDFTMKTIGLDRMENRRRNLYFSHVVTKRLDYIQNPNFDFLCDNIAFGWTLTGHDELEPNASPNTERINAMRRMAERGYKTWASIEPVIDFDASFEMIQQALEAGCEHFKIGLMTKNTKVCRRGFKLGEKSFEPYNVGHLVNFIKNVMKPTEGHATVYWKQSVVDFLEGSDKKHPTRIYNRVQTMSKGATYGMTAREFLSQWPHSVGKDWSMFNSK